MRTVKPMCVNMSVYACVCVQFSYNINKFRYCFEEHIFIIKEKKIEAGVKLSGRMLAWQSQGPVFDSW